MNKEFLQNQMKHFIYRLKEDTASSYYSDTDTILPERLSISVGNIMKVQNKGRIQVNGSKGQLTGNFKQSEESPLMKNKPYTCRTQIFPCGEDYPLLFGYGTIGISNEEGKVTRASDTGDLVVLYSSDKGKTYHIFFFFKLGEIQHKDEVLSFVHEWVKANLF